MSEIVRGKGPGVGLDEIYQEIRGHKSVDWGISFLCTLIDEGEINFDPEYQRGHVWTESQQKDFVGFILEGGRQPDVFVRELPIVDGLKPPFYEVVDGKQRMTAFYRWWTGRIPGRLSEDWDHREIWIHELDATEIRFTRTRMNTSVQFLVGHTDAQIMRFYLRLNRGGTIHTDKEIARVRELYEKAKSS